MAYSSFNSFFNPLLIFHPAREEYQNFYPALIKGVRAGAATFCGILKRRRKKTLKGIFYEKSCEK
jgi:hypothetical protein